MSPKRGANRSTSGIGLRIRRFEASASPKLRVPCSPIHGHAGGYAVQDLLLAVPIVRLSAEVLQIQMDVFRKVVDNATVDTNLVLHVAVLDGDRLVIVGQEDASDACARKEVELLHHDLALRIVAIEGTEVVARIERRVALLERISHAQAFTVVPGHAQMYGADFESSAVSNTCCGRVARSA